MAALRARREEVGQAFEPDFGQTMKKLLAILFVTLCGTVPRAAAHPAPSAHAVVDIGDDGAYRITLHADVAALVMQAPPGHLGDDRAAEMRAMSDKELQAWVDDARKALALRLVVVFDGQPSTLEEILFPDLAELRQNAVTHNTDGTQSRIRLRGRVPSQARTVTLTFPQDVGPVQLTVRWENQTLHTLQLEAGQTSRALALLASRASLPQPTTPTLTPVLAIVVGAGALCLGGWIKRRRDRAVS